MIPALILAAALATSPDAAPLTTIDPDPIGAMSLRWTAIRTLATCYSRPDPDSPGMYETFFGGSVEDFNDNARLGMTLINTTITCPNGSHYYLDFGPAYLDQEAEDDDELYFFCTFPGIPPLVPSAFTVVGARYGPPPQGWASLYGNLVTTCDPFMVYSVSIRARFPNLSE